MIENPTILRLKNKIDPDLYKLLTSNNIYILQLTLKKTWYNRIVGGEKKEEYREIKPYWTHRFIDRFLDFCDYLDVNLFHIETKESWNECYKHFDYVIFRNGYKKNSPLMLVECKGISTSYGNKDWGADGITKFYTIKLGDVLYFDQCN